MLSWFAAWEVPEASPRWRGAERMHRNDVSRHKRKPRGGPVRTSTLMSLSSSAVTVSCIVFVLDAAEQALVFCPDRCREFN